MGHVGRSSTSSRYGSCVRIDPHPYASWASNIATRVTRVSLTDRGARWLVPRRNPLLGAASAAYGWVRIGVGSITVGHCRPPGTQLARVAWSESGPCGVVQARHWVLNLLYRPHRTVPRSTSPLPQWGPPLAGRIICHSGRFFRSSGPLLC